MTLNSGFGTLISVLPRKQTVFFAWKMMVGRSFPFEMVLFWWTCSSGVYFVAEWINYCWWFRNPANQLRLVVYPTIYKVLAPSQVVGLGISYEPNGFRTSEIIFILFRDGQIEVLMRQVAGFVGWIRWSQSLMVSYGNDHLLREIKTGPRYLETHKILIRIIFSDIWVNQSEVGSITLWIY